MNITTIGVDLAKSVFQVHGVDKRERPSRRRRRGMFEKGLFYRKYSDNNKTRFYPG